MSTIAVDDVIRSPLIAIASAPTARALDDLRRSAAPTR